MSRRGSCRSSGRGAGGEQKNIVVCDEFVSDNFPPDYVFRAATSDIRDQGSTQLCHIYGGNGEARDTFLYTNVANLCLMPSFLAKFADTDPAIVDLLKDAPTCCSVSTHSAHRRVARRTQACER